MEFRGCSGRSVLGAVALAAVLVSSAAAAAEDAKTYPDWEGLWNRGSPVGSWTPASPRASGSRRR
jgi:hypothetical protein